MTLLNIQLLKKLSNDLQEQYKFPPISNFLIFCHQQASQPVHIDGTSQYRYASLNLTIKGYQNTKMMFYKQNESNMQTTISNAYYFDKQDLLLVDELKGSNDWVLINSGVPHQAIGVNLNDTRITVCIRFLGNPTFENLLKNAGY